MVNLEMVNVNLEAVALLRVARRDLVAASYLREPHASEASWGLLIHQVLEKTLKAWLVNLEVLSPVSHDLKSLLNNLSKQNVDVVGLEEFAIFNPFAMQFRQESDPDPLYLNRRFWEMRAKELVDHVSTLTPV